MNQEDFFKKVVSHAKEYGFIFPSSDIYDGLAAVYDYGQLGTELKNNIKQYWWRSMVQYHENIVGIDSAIFMHPRIWKASGHVDAFNDPLIDNKDSKKRYRADVLIEDHIAKIEEKINKECEKAHKRFGDAFDRQQFVTTNARVLEHQKQIDEIRAKYAELMNANDLAGLKPLILDLGIVCPVSGTRNWTDVRQFIFRMREFEQMEMQFFVRPGTEMEWFKYWKEERLKWHLALGIPAEKYRYHDHEKLAHYANAATDIEFEFPFGFKELEGIHSRTDFDLSRHSEFSGKKLQYFDSELNESYTPYVIETSIGVDRTFLAIFSHALVDETLEDGSVRTVLRLPASLAPYKAAVLPLVKKDGLPEKSREIMDMLKYDFMMQYDEKDAIGRRYRRQDAIGTPFCITVDNDTLNDNSVTVRHRDTMQQERIPIENLRAYLQEGLRVKK